jgi:hypothetical protein
MFKLSQYFNLGRISRVQAPDGVHDGAVFVDCKAIKHENSHPEQNNRDVKEARDESAHATSAFGYFEEFEESESV